MEKMEEMEEMEEMEKVEVVGNGEIARWLFYNVCGSVKLIVINCECGSTSRVLRITPHLGKTTVEAKCEGCSRDLVASLDFEPD